MDDDNTKEDNQPSTSRKESQRVNSDHDTYDDRGRDDPPTNSESSVSATYSVRSRLDMNEARPEVPKPSLAINREQKPERKKRGRRTVGRVEKRRRSGHRRQAVRRAPKRKPRQKDRKERNLSVSTIFTRLSTSGSRTPGCIHCGHRCCRRRYEYELRMARNARMARMKRRQAQRTRRIKKRRRKKVSNRRTIPAISPEMIHESLRRLTMWRQYVITSSIADDLKRNYPVNPDETELLQELREKLRIAAVVGIVRHVDDNYWCLSCALQKRKLSKSHVTMFWKVFGDTMRPVTKKDTEPKDTIACSDEQTSAGRNTKCVIDSDTI